MRAKIGRRSGHFDVRKLTAKRVSASRARWLQYRRRGSATAQDRQPTFGLAAISSAQIDKGIDWPHCFGDGIAMRLENRTFGARVVLVQLTNRRIERATEFVVEIFGLDMRGRLHQPVNQTCKAGLLVDAKLIDNLALVISSACFLVSMARAVP